ncbi:hypothetical protein MMC07_009168 [Pseudocyphellaria aurata]|nr:hypothetical protein [Pseudocyphellaria aurata]
MLLKKKVAIIELVLFVPVLLLVLFTIVRRRSIKQLQWFFLFFVCLVHIISAALEAAPGQANEKVVDHAERTIILDNIALCLLLMALLQALREINDPTSPTFLRKRGLDFMHVPSIIGVILSIIGATYLPSQHDSRVLRGETLFRAGWVMFLFVYLVLVQLIIILASEYRRRYRSERYVLIALVVAIPLLAARFVYVLLAEFTDIGLLSNFVSWNAIGRLCLVALIDVAVVALYTVTSLIPSPERGRKLGPQLLPLRGESLDGRQSP